MDNDRRTRLKFGTNVCLTRIAPDVLSDQLLEAVSEEDFFPFSSPVIFPE